MAFALKEQRCQHDSIETLSTSFARRTVRQRTWHT